MKYQNLIYCFIITFLMSCGSTERVVAGDGKVYEVSGSKIRSNGSDVTDVLSNERKSEISTILNKNREAAEAAERMQQELEDKKDELEQAQKEAEKKQEELEDKQEELEEKREEREDARKDYLKAEKKLKSQQSKFEKKKLKGKLSPNDEEKWLEKIKDLTEDLNEAKKEWDKLK